MGQRNVGLTHTSLQLLQKGDSWKDEDKKQYMQGLGWWESLCAAAVNDCSSLFFLIYSWQSMASWAALESVCQLLIFCLKKTSKQANITIPSLLRLLNHFNFKKKIVFLDTEASKHEVEMFHVAALKEKNFKFFKHFSFSFESVKYQKYSVDWACICEFCWFSWTILSWILPLVTISYLLISELMCSQVISLWLLKVINLVFASIFKLKWRCFLDAFSLCFQMKEINIIIPFFFSPL